MSRINQIFAEKNINLSLNAYNISKIKIKSEKLEDEPLVIQELKSVKKHLSIQMTTVKLKAS